MKRFFGGMVVLLILVLAIPGWAQIRPGTSSATIFIGGYVFDRDQEVKNAPINGIRVGYDFTRRFGLEGVLGYTRTQYWADWDLTKTTLENWANAREHVTDVYHYRLEGLFYLLPDGKVVPYLAAGIGGQTIDYPTYKADKNSFLADVEVGLKWFLYEHMALRLDIRAPYIFS